MLKSLGDSGPPWVTPRLARNTCPYRPEALQTRTALSQKYMIRRIMFGPIPYPTRISLHCPLSIASHAFFRSMKIIKRECCLMNTSCWTSLASSPAVPYPLPFTNPWRQSRNVTTCSRLSMMISRTFQNGSRRPIPLKLPPPLGRSTTTTHIICRGMSPVFHTICIGLTKACHLSPISSFSAFSPSSMSFSHCLMCSALNSKAPPARPRFKPSFTASGILRSPGTASGTAKGTALMGIGSPEGSTFSYNCTRSAVCFSIVS
mmetsp:Transcript_21821/g.47507  ORF Transcript_21821/g.47507 Transcript_21821/m.47507 type:complete len:261 (-) Transcript_21821:1162-1944(-)